MTNLKNSKGQTGHAFTFLFAMIVIIATVWIGGKLIGSFSESSCEAELVEFKNSFKRALDSNAVFGSRNFVDITSPCDAKQLCIADNRMVKANVAFPDSIVPVVDNPSIKVSLSQGVEENVFLISEDDIFGSYDQRIILSKPEEDPAENVLCLNVSTGSFMFSTEGFGRTILLGAS